MPDRIPTFRPKHLDTIRIAQRKDYDRYQRDRESKQFYASRRWRSARLMKLQTHPLCERCDQASRKVLATIVHHKQELRDRPDLGLDLDNLESLCPSCHSRHHAAAPDLSKCMHATPPTPPPTPPRGGGSAAAGA